MEQNIHLIEVNSTLYYYNVLLFFIVTYYGIMFEKYAVVSF